MGELARIELYLDDSGMMLKLTRLYWITLSLLCVSHLSLASDHNNLQTLNSRISAVKHSLNQARNQKSALQEKLARTETAKGELSQQIQKSQQKLQIEEALLKKLNQEQTQLQAKARAEQQAVSQQLVDAYKVGQEPYLKLLLDQQDNSDMSRFMVYYDILTRQQIETFQQYQTTLATLSDTTNKQLKQYQAVKKLLASLSLHQAHYATLTHTRKELINSLNHSIQNKQQQLNELIINKKHLESEIESLEGSSHYNTAFGKAFNHLQGKLSWPAQGHVQNLFGTPIQGSEINWDGILIQANLGQKVHTVADGKVIFAKWLEGYGLLMIINHGDGYMTLYGRNDVLYKKAGDVVHAGDLIASVGKSGGYDESALYFAIRHNAKPLNPISWCHG